MKELYVSLACSLFLLSACILPGSSASQTADANSLPAQTKEEAAAAALPMTMTEELRYIDLEENQKEILDEVLSDHVSEEVVRLQELGFGYSIGDWVDKGSLTYLFFEKQLPEGRIYTACGYSQKADGSYVYFELSSKEPLTQEIIGQKVLHEFPGAGMNTEDFCL